MRPPRLVKKGPSCLKFIFLLGLVGLSLSLGSFQTPRADSHWISLSPMQQDGAPMMGTECTDWPGLGHMITLE